MATKKKSVKKVVKKEPSKKTLRAELVRQMITLSTSGFGLVAALAWNNFIQELVNSYIKKVLPSGSGIISLLIYAILITCMAVFVTYQLGKLLEHVTRS
jgi:hypothetical protein